jgi:exopolysaccharide production protein ExoQ
VRTTAECGTRGFRQLPWTSFLLLTIVFWFGSRADVFYSTTQFHVADGLLETSRPDDWTKAAALAVFTVWSLYTLLRNHKFALRLRWPHGGFLLAYLICCFGSVLWTDGMGLTERKLLTLAISCIGAIAISVRFSLEEITSLTFFSCSLLAAISVAAEVILGNFRVWTPDYRFSGLWHPNGQAVNLAYVVLSALALARWHRRYHAAFYGAAIVAFLLLGLTRSRTAFASLVVSAFVSWFLSASGRKRSLFVLTAAATSCLMIFLAATGALRLSTDSLLLGRQDSDPTTLTNRVPIWRNCLSFAAKRPLLGYGYGAFWTAERIIAVTGPDEAAWIPPSQQHFPDSIYVDAAHNSYLAALVDTGMLGSFLFTAALISALLAYGRGVLSSRSPLWLCAFSLLLFLVVEMTLEAIPLNHFMPVLTCPILLAKIGFVAETSEASTPVEAQQHGSSHPAWAQV